MPFDENEKSNNIKGLDLVLKVWQLAIHPIVFQ